MFDRFFVQFYLSLFDSQVKHCSSDTKEVNKSHHTSHKILHIAQSVYVRLTKYCSKVKDCCSPVNSPNLLRFRKCSSFIRIMMPSACPSFKPVRGGRRIFWNASNGFGRTWTSDWKSIKDMSIKQLVVDVSDTLIFKLVMEISFALIKTVLC